VRVWIAAAKDAPEVGRLMVEFRDWQERDWPSDEDFHRIVRELIARDDTDFLLGAADDGPPVAVVQLRFRPSIWMDADDCCLEDLWVEEHARRGGLGGAMVEAAVARARERGCRRIELDTGEDNRPARRLYERHGFSTGRGDHHGIFMRRRIAENMPPRRD
jgi:GNAT superfamily N-acetyltransferase